MEPLARSDVDVNTSDGKYGCDEPARATAELHSRRLGADVKIFEDQYGCGESAQASVEPLARLDTNANISAGQCCCDEPVRAQAEPPSRQLDANVNISASLITRL